MGAFRFAQGVVHHRSPELPPTCFAMHHDTADVRDAVRAGRKDACVGQQDAFLVLAEHMQRIGRLYLTTPVYRAFSATPDGLAFAEGIYAKAKPAYHPMTQKAVEGIFAKAKAHQGKAN